LRGRLSETLAADLPFAQTAGETALSKGVTTKIARVEADYPFFVLEQLLEDVLILALVHGVKPPHCADRAGCPCLDQSYS
jgi:hypothetical protein